MELQGKIAVVTGAGMGMGKELALREFPCCSIMMPYIFVQCTMLH
jgi:hypothetical protein